MFSLINSKLNTFRKKLLPKPTPCIIITRGRTGSHLLSSLFKNHPQIASHGEIITDNRLKNSAFQSNLNKEGVKQFVLKHFKRHGREKVNIIKLLYYQIENDYAERYDIKNLNDMVQHLTNDKKIKIIHLKRKNKLATLLSIKTAAITGQYAANNKTAIESPRIELNYKECLDEFNRIEEWESYYDNIFSKHKIINVNYEDLVNFRKNELDKIYKFLKVKDFELKSELKKQNTASMNDRISNYDDIKDKFKDTRWALLFE